MRALIIGQGSMGKRRVRNLRALGGVEMDAFDVKAERREESHRLYGIRVLDRLPALEEYDVAIICTPPDLHTPYIRQALDAGRPCFVEASAILEDLPPLLKHPNYAPARVAPSCTMRFHPSIRKIKELVDGGTLGAVTGFSYHFGMYLPDWHPWEQMTDFYAGRRRTGACREMVPFELTWLVDVFGFPERATGCCVHSGHLEADIDDVYAAILKYPRFGATLQVEVLARFATRSLIANLQHAQVRWNWERREVWVYDARQKQERVHPVDGGTAHQGYHEHIGEEMYVDELAAFLESARGGAPFPHTLESDIRVLNLLRQIESPDGAGQV